MSGSAPTPNEAVLLLLAEAESASSRQIGERLAMPERSVRRRLARMIRDGYVFSPERGRYRLTAAGAAVMAPRPQLAREEVASGLARFLRTRR